MALPGSFRIRGTHAKSIVELLRSMPSFKHGQYSIHLYSGYLNNKHTHVSAEQSDTSKDNFMFAGPGLSSIC